MTPDKLPEEMQEQIKQKAEDFANSHVNGRTQRDIWELVFKANRAGATAWAPWKVRYDELQAQLQHKDFCIEQLQQLVDADKKHFEKLQAQAQRMADALAEIAESNCDYESMNYAKAVHNPECRACKAKAALQQFKDGKGKDNPCPHCGKELSRDRNLCCRECGKEVGDDSK